MNPKHITELVRDSRRIDIRQDERRSRDWPSQVVSVPDEWGPSYSQHEIAYIEVNRRPVTFYLLTRWTARLLELPPKGAVVSLYWVHPASRSSQVINYLRDTSDAEEPHPAAVGGSKGWRATYPSPAPVYGLQAPSKPY